MRKIKTIFDRDWEGNRGVIDKLVVDFDFDNAIPTEKVDGTNVRLTVRNHTLVRLEKRCNPSKIQKKQGIDEPWYVDADEFSPSDKYIWEASRNTDLFNVEDGEWSGEAIGPKIQGNPLNLDEHYVMLFSCGIYFPFYDAPHTYSELKDWLPKQKSNLGVGCGIEGIVWHGKNGDMVKIKKKDFK